MISRLSWSSTVLSARKRSGNSIIEKAVNALLRNRRLPHWILVHSEEVFVLVCIQLHPKNQTQP